MDHITLQSIAYYVVFVYNFFQKIAKSGWGSRIWTYECKSQSLVPYRLAIPQCGVSRGIWTHDIQSHNLALYQLNYTHHMVCQKGFEPLTLALEGRCSIQLSYWHMRLFGAGDGNRTHVTSLEGWGSTIELHPHIYKTQLYDTKVL